MSVPIIHSWRIVGHLWLSVSRHHGRTTAIRLGLR